MRKTVSILFSAALLTLCLTAMAFAQEGKPAEKARIVPKMSPDSAKAMMIKMSENYQAMGEDVKKLDAHVKSMMSMEDMDALHEEMQKHVDMMKSMNMMMVEQNRACRMIMDPSMKNKMLKMEQMKIKTIEKKKPEKTEEEKKN